MRMKPLAYHVSTYDAGETPHCDGLRQEFVEAALTRDVLHHEWITDYLIDRGYVRNDDD